MKTSQNENLTTEVDESLLKKPFKDPGEYHFYDKIEDYRPQAYYSKVDDDENLKRQLEECERSIQQHKHYEWIPQ
jgi:hypothetical protein